jgi:transposase
LYLDPDTQAIIEYLCSESNKLTNCAVYYARQIFFKAHRYVSKAELDKELKTNRHFQSMYSQATQQTCHTVFEAFKSFKALNSMFKRGKLVEKPRPPKYRKGGLNIVSYPKQALKLVDGNIRIPLGKKALAWFGIDSFSLKMPSNLSFADIKELRILPRNRCFYAEFIYRLPEEKKDVVLAKSWELTQG